MITFIQLKLECLNKHVMLVSSIGIIINIFVKKHLHNRHKACKPKLDPNSINQSWPKNLHGSLLRTTSPAPRVHDQENF